MRLTLLFIVLFSAGNCELCTSKFSLTPPSTISPHDAIKVEVHNDEATISYDSNRFANESDIINLLKNLTNSVVTSLHDKVCDSCDLCDYCVYDPLYDNTYGTGGAHHNFLCSDATNCQGCDLVQSYVPDACDSDESVSVLFPSNVAFLGWSTSYKESCPHKCPENFDCTLKCSHSQHTVNIHLQFDDKPSELYWQLFDNETRQVMAQGGYYRDTLARQSKQITSCVTAGCYGLTLVDSEYNGMPTGSYSIHLDGVDIRSSSGDYNFSRVEYFCIDTVESPARAEEADPPPPPPGSRQAYSVGFTIVASGSVSDFDAARITTLKTKCSEATGIPVSNISMEVTAASVTIVTRFDVTGLDQARQLESTLVTGTASEQAVDTLFGGEVTTESIVGSVTFEQVESYCSCKSEWISPCTDGVTRNGCDRNSCGGEGEAHALYCPATDPTCTPDPELQNPATEAILNTGNEFVFWCSPSCIDDPNGDIQRQGWGSTPASACASLVDGLQTSHSKTLEEACNTDLSSGMGVLVKHYCPIKCDNTSPLCPKAPPPPGAGVIAVSSPPPTSASPPPVAASPLSPPVVGDSDDSDDVTNTVLLVVAIVLGVLVVLGGIAIVARRYGIGSVQMNVEKPPEATVVTDAPTVASATIRRSSPREGMYALPRIPITSTPRPTPAPVPPKTPTVSTSGPVLVAGPAKPPPKQPTSAPPPSLKLPAPSPLPDPASTSTSAAPPVLPLQSSVNQMLVPSRRSPRRSRSSSPRRG